MVNKKHLDNLIYEVNKVVRIVFPFIVSDSVSIIN